MRLSRPYIPIPVRALVAERQMLALTGCVCTDEWGVRLPETNASFGTRLKAALFHLSRCGTMKMELHHRPALENREFNKRTGKYKPDANDPAFLVYLEKHEHLIETHVRGVGAMRSDTAEAKRRRKITRNREKRALLARGNRPKGYKPIPQRKNPWPKRKFETRKVRD